MRQMPSGQARGLSLIELAIILVILGILAAIALPKIIDLKRDAEESTEKATICAVQSGISGLSGLEEVKRK